MEQENSKTLKPDYIKAAKTDGTTNAVGASDATRILRYIIGDDIELIGIDYSNST